CIGACLTQEADTGEEKPIHFLSHKLSASQTKWSVIEKEAFAIHFALQKLDYYLHSATFVIRCDHKPLRYLLDSPIQDRKIARWALSLAGYACTIEYIEGSKNYCADLLSRLPDSEKNHGSSEQNQWNADEHQSDEEPDIDSRTLQICVINSDHFDPKNYASCEVKTPDEIIKPDIDLPKEIDNKNEQLKDETIAQLRNRLRNGKATKTEDTHYFESEDDLLFYLSQPDSEDPRLRLYIPRSLEERVITQYHDELGHMATDKTYDTMRLKYFFPSMYKKIDKHIQQCITCQIRSDKKSRPPQQETDIPPYPFAKIGVDLSGPYSPTLSGNKYTVSFVDLYSGWPEAWPVADKSADNIVNLLIEEIIPRYGCPLELLSDNGTENLNRKMKETLEEMHIHHVKTSFYSPSSNGKTERFHRTLHQVLSKKVAEDASTWDLYLNQALAAIRFHVSEPTRKSPYFLLYNRDVVLPLDTILRPRRRYMGEELHKVALQEQHKSFIWVHKHLKEVKQKQKEYSDRNSKEIQFQIGDPVYLKNHRKMSKLDGRWLPYYRITNQTGPLSFTIRNQLNGTVTKTHTRHIRPAEIEEWQIPKATDNRRLHSYAVPPIVSDEETDIPDKTALDRAVRGKRQEHEYSSDDEDIPIAELQRRIRFEKNLKQVNDGYLDKETEPN
ncbi:RNase H-like domain-containing protein, partial [Solemya velum gill symbiont]|uniref:RNase H-like domain-containing protein n=1 Tax=Solemya velum gill symbiont TaxID=2340 RepID=UPI0009983D25